MASIDSHTRRMLAENANLNRERIDSSRRSRIDTILDICAGADIAWAVWPSGQSVVKGHDLVATGAPRTSWIAIPCADEAEAVELERKLA